MANTPEKLLSMYERGVLTSTELISFIVEATVGPPTAELIERMPREALEEIRRYASLPVETPGILICSVSAMLSEHWEAHQRESSTRWNRGLTFWREYFGFTD